MKKTITALSLVAALFTASTIPAASAAPAAPELPAACAGIVTDLAGKLTKTVSSLLPLPNVGAVTPLIGDMLGLVTALQSSGCLPALPTSGLPVPVPVKEGVEYAGPVDQCLPVVLNLVSTIAGLGGTVLGAAGGALPDVGKLTGLLTTLLKTVTDLLSKCGLPAPPGGLPALPGLPLPIQNS
ncbi:hypothetical protein JNUCC0626_40975 [Lentzea sp. JNUCC 0626]|uniref:hypothetical protein n=1 Tax=Lentzea sp. JNUCC 0626 TaxID=3367513 RepID=UPI0037494466